MSLQKLTPIAADTPGSESSTSCIASRPDCTTHPVHVCNSQLAPLSEKDLAALRSRGQPSMNSARRLEKQLQKQEDTIAQLQGQLSTLTHVRKAKGSKSSKACLIQ